MQFRLQTLLLAFVVLWASLAVFGGIGILAFVIAICTASLIGYSWKIWGKIFFGVLALSAAAILLLWPTYRLGYEDARRIQCCCPLKENALAIHNYAAAYQSLPPAYTTDASGRPAVSWRVILLPFIENDDLAKKFKMNESWDGPNNKKLLSSRPKDLFACVSDKAAMEDGVSTTYVAVVGRHAFWQPGKTRTFNDPDLHNNLSKTVMLVEVADAHIAWSEPRDFSLDEFEAKGKAASVKVWSKHRKTGIYSFFFHDVISGAYVVLADSSYEFLPQAALESPKLKDWLAVGGYNEMEIKSLPPGPPLSRPINWTNCTALAVWLASTFELLRRARKSGKQNKSISPRPLAGEGPGVRA
jgi:hypothetical protein